MKIPWITALLLNVLTGMQSVSSHSKLVVEFKDTILAEDGEKLVEEMKAILTSSSKVLQNAIGVGFYEVTFSIPNFWDTSEWEGIEITDALVENSKADVTVNPVADSVFGKNIGAVQFGQCGSRGLHINVPVAFLKEETPYPKDKGFAREWLKYKYGVFDENGFPDDDMYPLFTISTTSDGANFKVTDCTNDPVSYNILDEHGKECAVEDLINKTCSIQLDEKGAENITSSFMYYQESLAKMDYICGRDNETEHNPFSPNKQNILCNSKSIWDIVKSSKDFPQTNLEAVEEIVFKYVKKENIFVVVAWDNTNKVTPKARILKAVKKLLYDLPDGSSYSLFPFTSEPVTEDYPLTELKDWPGNRPRDIPSDFVEPVEACTKCAIEKALEILVPKESPENKLLNRHAIIISTRNPEKDDNLIEKVKSSNVCFLFLAFTGSETTEEGFKDYTEASGCGGFWSLSLDDDQRTEFEKMYTAMETVLPKVKEGRARETVETKYLSSGNAVGVFLNPTIHKVTFWILNSIQPKYINFTLNGEKVEMVQEVSTDILAFAFFPEKSDESGELSCILKHEIADSLLQIQVTSKQGDYLSGDILIEDTTENTQQMPVIVYAVVYFGGYPVQNAIVTASISRPNAKDVKMELYDNGRGDPDITKNDGIYSRYFIDFSEKGEYTVTVMVTNSDSTVVGQVTKVENFMTCCGSSVTLGSSEVSNFTETYVSTFTAISGRPEQGYKPSTIRDLRIKDIDSEKVILMWTAPGGEADHGKVSKYEFKLFKHKNMTNELDFNEWLSLKDDIVIEPYNVEHIVTLIFNKPLLETHTLTLSIISNNENMSSELSNSIILIGYAQDISITPDPKSKTAVATIIGSTIAGVIGILFVVFLIFYCKKYKKDREFDETKKIENKDVHEKETKIELEDTRQSNTEISAKKIEPFPVVLYTHDQLKDFKRKNKEPPLFKAPVLPKPWTSLDVLSSTNANKEFEYETKSLRTASTNSTNEIASNNGNHSSTEIKHLDDVSRDFDLKHEKVEKF